MDPSLKDRESQVEDNEPQHDDADPAVEVSQENGETVVKPTGLTKREMRQRQWNERVGSVVAEQNKPVHDKLEHLTRTLEGLQGALERARQQPGPHIPPEANKPSLDPEFMSVRRRQGEIMKLMGQAKTQQEVDRLETEFYELDQQALDARARKLAEEQVGKFRQDYQQQEPLEVRQLKSEYKDVFARPDVLALAGTYFQQERFKAGNGPFDEMAAHRKALQLAAEQAGMRRPPAPAPKPHEQARFGGAPPSSGAGNVPRGSVKLSKEQQQVAWARYKDLPAAEAERKWAEAMVRRDPHFFG